MNNFRVRFFKMVYLKPKRLHSNGMNCNKLFNSIISLPIASEASDIHQVHARYREACSKADTSLLAFADWLTTDETMCQLLHGLYCHSPYLWGITLKHPDFIRDIALDGLDESIDKLYTSMNSLTFNKPDELMRHLRHHKTRLALTVAIAEITLAWPLEKVTSHLSEFASNCLKLSCDMLFRQAHDKGDIILPNPDKPQENCGFIILGMGKLGARELNYSSDIDLILLYEKEKVNYTGKQTMQQFFNRISHDLVRIMQERTADGYIFRTDLRLRPDPASTPPAMSTNGAMTYYETVGQNWERAALIKARPVAGDMDAGREFLKRIVPFIWRKHLDFAAIADIHSIKRQIDAKAGGKIQLAGHNIKLGIGGIREIEFFAQIHQLIWGGRMFMLRTVSTCETLNALTDAELITQETCATLCDAYYYYRRIEHHLQMVADNQTHSLPQKPEELLSIAQFMGYKTLGEFEEKTITLLTTVHDIFISHFKAGESLGAEGSLVFTGVENDPDTLNTITAMGYENSARVSEIIQGWHRGSRRATRTKRARELITELTPLLLKELAATANPDDAFLRFDEFLSRLPAGVQLFSLFSVNPELIELLATIMGSAPAIAEKLSKDPHLLDTVLSGAFYEEFPDKKKLEGHLLLDLSHTRHIEDEIHTLRRFKSEKQFQAGIQLLKNHFGASAVGIMLSDIAEIVLDKLQEQLLRVFAESYGYINNGALATIALGKLGARELTFGSDLDLVFVYDAPGDDTTSDGEKSFSASVYYNRLVQRYISQLTSIDKGGRFYEVDTRLRPSGSHGPLAVSLEAFDKYFTESAWTFELMALTRARVISTPEPTRTKLNDIIRKHLCKPREEAVLRGDIFTMRKKIEQEFPAKHIWDIKYARGGLIDIDFIAQYLILLHASSHPDIIIPSSLDVFTFARNKGLLDKTTALELIEAYDLQSRVLSYLRLCQVDPKEGPESSAGLCRLITQSFAVQNLESLKTKLESLQNLVYVHFQDILKK